MALRASWPSCAASWWCCGRAWVRGGPAWVRGKEGYSRVGGLYAVLQQLWCSAWQVHARQARFAKCCHPALGERVPTRTHASSANQSSALLFRHERSTGLDFARLGSAAGLSSGTVVCGADRASTPLAEQHGPRGSGQSSCQRPPPRCCADPASLDEAGAQLDDAAGPDALRDGGAPAAALAARWGALAGRAAAPGALTREGVAAGERQAWPPSLGLKPGPCPLLKRPQNESVCSS